MGHARTTTIPLAAEKVKWQTPRKGQRARNLNCRDLIAGQEDSLGPLSAEALPQLSATEQDEALQAGKSERTLNRLGVPGQPTHAQRR